MKTEGQVDTFCANEVEIGYGYAKGMRGQGGMDIRGY